MACPFCGSKELLVVRPGEFEQSGMWPVEMIPKKDWCCKAQAHNSKHREKKYVFGQESSIEKIGKL